MVKPIVGICVWSGLSAWTTRQVPSLPTASLKLLSSEERSVLHSSTHWDAHIGRFFFFVVPMRFPLFPFQLEYFPNFKTWTFMYVFNTVSAIARILKWTGDPGYIYIVYTYRDSGGLKPPSLTASGSKYRPPSVGAPRPASYIHKRWFFIHEIPQ